VVLRRATQTHPVASGLGCKYVPASEIFTAHAWEILYETKESIAHAKSDDTSGVKRAQKETEQGFDGH
jgi:hypothetical protein